MGLDREPRKGVSLEEHVVDQVYLCFCPVTAALEKPSVMPQWENSGLEPTRSRDPGRGGTEHRESADS